MKTSNFPQKKNMRRVGALTRLTAKLRSVTDSKKQKRIKAEMDTLLSRVVTDARNVRTKKVGNRKTGRMSR